MTRWNGWRWAVRALRNEVLEFRLEYPIEETPLAGPNDSLHYYVFSERLFRDSMELQLAPAGGE